MKIYESDGRFHFVNNVRIIDKLEPGNYEVEEEKGNFLLSKINNFEVPDKVYGNLEQDSDFYVNAFKRGNKNLGILLNGEKGSGKSLLGALICQKLNIPVLCINRAYSGPGFISFINNVTQPIVIMIDEFDKIYTEPLYNYDGDKTTETDQTALLKLMDAANVSNKLFILTSNKSRVSEYMINRPSRIRYKQLFGKLTDEEILEVLEHRLNKDLVRFIPEFIELSSIFFGFNLDTLMTITDEVNFHKISPKVLVKRMNLVPESESFEVVLTEDSKEYSTNRIVDFNPMEDANIPYLCFSSAEKNVKDNKEKEFYREINSNVNSVNQYLVTHTSKGMVYKHKKEEFSLLFKRYNKVNRLVF